jgi:hypothetical protein
MRVTHSGTAMLIAQPALMQMVRDHTSRQSGTGSIGVQREVPIWIWMAQVPKNRKTINKVSKIR